MGAIVLCGRLCKSRHVAAERCDQCGFDGDTCTDTDATDAIAELPNRWMNAVSGLANEELSRRRVPAMWSIAEYVDHVREVLFGMRFVLDSAVVHPGIDLGDNPEPVFAPVARTIDVAAALSGIDREASALRDRLDGLSSAEWSATAIVGGDRVDARWIARHAVHDATHHLLDVERRASTGSPAAIHRCSRSTWAYRPCPGRRSATATSSRVPSQPSG
jgi:hypothetical protein